MEKYGQSNEDIINGLRDEEAQLMQQVQQLMTSSEKNASVDKKLAKLNIRLSQVRGTITDFDLRNAKPSDFE